MFKQLHCNDMDFLKGESSSEDDDKRKKVLLRRSDAKMFQSHRSMTGQLPSKEIQADKK